MDILDEIEDFVTDFQTTIVLWDYRVRCENLEQSRLVSEMNREEFPTNQVDNRPDCTELIRRAKEWYYKSDRCWLNEDWREAFGFVKIGISNSWKIWKTNMEKRGSNDEC